MSLAPMVRAVFLLGCSLVLAAQPVCAAVEPVLSTSRLCTFAVKPDGTLWGWGKNGMFLGIGSTDSFTGTEIKWRPVQVGNSADWLTVSTAGGLHTLAVKQDGTL